MRIAIGNLHGNPDQELRTATWGRVDGENSADGIQPLLDPDKTEAAALAVGLHCREIEADSIILNGTAQHLFFFVHANADLPGLCMFRRIGKRFLNDAIECGLERTGKAASDFCLDANGDAGALRDALCQEANGGEPAEVIQNGGAKLVGVTAQLGFDLIQQFFNSGDVLMLVFRQAAAKFRKGQMDGHQAVARFVVHRVPNSLDFLLQGLVQVAQRLHRILKPAMRHFVRRQALGQEIGPGPQEIFARLSFLRRRNNILKRLMVKGRNLHQALAFHDGAAPEFVSAPKRGFAWIFEVTQKRRAIALLEACGRFRRRLTSDFHERIPVNRATSTSASSLPLRKRSRILSAARCGASRADRFSKKLLRTPSVTKNRVSPCATGSTVAWSGGNCAPTTPARRSRTSCTLPLVQSARINAPCTFPTPSQVIMPCTGSMDAMLSATPRVDLSFSWHSSTRAMIGSWTPLLRIADAALAAWAAS